MKKQVSSGNVTTISLHSSPAGSSLITKMTTTSTPSNNALTRPTNTSTPKIKVSAVVNGVTSEEPKSASPNMGNIDKSGKREINSRQSESSEIIFDTTNSNQHQLQINRKQSHLRFVNQLTFLEYNTDEDNKMGRKTSTATSAAPAVDDDRMIDDLDGK